MTDIHRNSKTLTFDQYGKDVMQSIGVSGGGIASLWKTPDKDEGPDCLHKALAHAGDDYYRKQWLPGNHLDVLWSESLALLAHSSNGTSF